MVWISIHEALDLHDHTTFELIGKGKTLAIFQFESEQMQESLKKLKPSDLEDLIAIECFVSSWSDG